MPTPTRTTRPAPTPAPAKKEEPVRRRANGGLPPYVRAKLAMSEPGDADEREADKVAMQVARSPRPAAATPQDALRRASVAPGVRQDGLSAQPLARLRRTPSTEPPEIQRTAVTPGAPAKSDVGLEQDIAARLGQGSALPSAARADMEARFAADFSAVRIHTDEQAQRLCARTSARAFTVGNDVFFAPGEFSPESDRGRELLAHELTHVLQSARGLQRLARAVDPAPEIPPDAHPSAQAKLDDISALELPPIKHRHSALYTGAGAKRAAGYARNTSAEQVTVWNQGVQISPDTIAQKLTERDKDFRRPQSPRAQVTFTAGKKKLSTPWRTLPTRLRIPDWDRQGNALEKREEKFQVDHMVELQVYGDTTGNAGNVIGNLELLKGGPNASSGAAIKTSLYEKVTAFLAVVDPDFGKLSADARAARRRNWLRERSMTFTAFPRGSGREPGPADWWTRQEILDAAPLEAVELETGSKLKGSPGQFVLASGVGGVEIARYKYDTLAFQPKSDRLRTALAGVRIQSFNLNEGVEEGKEGESIGTLSGTWDLPNGFRANEPITIALVGVAPYCGALGDIPGLNTDFSHLSPMSLPSMEIRDGRLYAEGTIQPTLPLLAGHPIQVILDGDDLRFEMSYHAGMITLPLPGVSIDDCSLRLFYSTKRGFGGQGDVEFSIAHVGSGDLTVHVSQSEGFSAKGSLYFDTKLFDRAQVKVWYREGAFGAEGDIGIDNPERIRGIRSANLSIAYGEGLLSAKGDVKPDIPGVEAAALLVHISEQEGLVIGGTLQLSANPAIRSGSIDVTVQEREEQWKVTANGKAQPALPGIDSELTVNYDDGAFDARLDGSFKRGMLAGTVQAGATNRTLDEAGQPTGPAQPGAPIIVYGGGKATVQIAPWLQGTAGIRFAPDGELSVSGEIGLPSSLEIFGRKQIDKKIFSIGTEIPIIPGIVAKISGSLSAHAGIGPGVLDQCRIAIDYNPAHEENTHVTGDAHLNVPADAGLRLAARGGVGLGIPGASATGGLELGGTLGIAGAAEASVHIDWMPNQGLKLDADAYLHAQPRFRFDVSGYVNVSALTVDIYDNRWELAAFEMGSDMRFGIRFPVRYREGQPFDVSLDDVQFEVPEIGADALLEQLGNQIF